MLSEIPFPLGFSLLGRHGISTFSLLLMACFLSASYIASRELYRRNLDPTVMDWALFLTIVGTVIGAKVFFVFEVWQQIWVIDVSFWDTFYRVFFTWSGMRHAGGESMWAHLFSGGGLVFYGGFFVSFLFLYIFHRMRKLEIWRYGDVYVITLALGYGIGRLGCFISGDGCFGHGSSGIDIPLLTWVYGPADGACPSDPALSWRYPYMCTAGVRVWNTPVIEALFSFGLFAFYMLWARYQKFKPGMLLAIFMVWNGIVRFSVEFLRLNDALIPILDHPSQGNTLLRHHIEQGHSLYPSAEYFLHWHWYGFTQAQIVAALMVTIGLVWIFGAKLHKRQTT